ncbi:hypothetical protein Pogu_0731 [Pyrobaculum oguniense TE7]|uniref:Uncharacterized protein n=1 Tax=Pyrobaculum oguniense (strain DSM 13380 / JCM 10595 / TE7) TaxID=698757 RepID=H6Q828_PYROT|nr:hypothetical protein Pogu_0731 [Pyrobaculum oguniense TE7]
MIALRDILIFAGLAMIAAVFIAALFPVQEGISPVPACSDCAFKLAGPYSIVQYGNYAAIQLGERQLARYGWAYMDGRPLRPGYAASCHPRPMYLWVVGGIAYVSCAGEEPIVGVSYAVSYTPPPLHPAEFLKLEITYHHGYPHSCRNNVHVTWGSTSADFCSSSSPGYATLWIDQATGQLVREAPGVTCSPAAPASVEKYSSGSVSDLNVEQDGNKVSFTGNGYVAQYGFSASVGNLRLTVYVLDTWAIDWGQGADVYFYLCS